MPHKIMTVLVTCGIGLISPIEAESASIEAELIGTSIALCQGLNSSATLGIQFTTYDGATTLPNVSPEATCEFLIASLTNGSPGFVADYIAFDSVGPFEFGAVVLNSFNRFDGNENLIPDVFEVPFPGSSIVGGETFPDFNVFTPVPNAKASLSGSFLRNAGNHSGSYSVTASSNLGVETYSGEFRLGYYSGTLTYDEFGGDLVIFNLAGDGLVATGTSTVTRVNANQVNINGFTMRDNRFGQNFFVSPIELLRDGRRFSGIVTLDDGYLGTALPDFREWVLDFEDFNDYDLDGLPDLVDPIIDTDGDGEPDATDTFPLDPTETTDSDGDSVGDNADAFPSNPFETADSDGDGVGDNSDDFPLDASEDRDSDGDGVGDNTDAFPDDPTRTTAGEGASACGFGIYRPSGGSNKFFLDVDQTGTSDVSFEFGPVGSDVYVGKWNGSADNVAVRREVGGNGLGKFFINTDTDPQAESSFVLGRLQDAPIWGDFTGTGTATLGIKRNVGNVAKYFVDTTGNGRPNSVRSFNRFDDISVVGDWDGSGSDNIGTVKVVGVGLKWILRNDNGTVTRVNFGRASTDTPVVGDFDGDGDDDIGIVRTLSVGGAKWIIDLNQNGVPDESFNFGRSTDLPQVCDWDGDGREDPGYVRRGSGRMLFTTNPNHLPGGAGGSTVRFGIETDTPIVGIWQ